MKLRSLALACATLVSLAACGGGGDSAASGGTTVNLSGVVASGKPLAGVNVTVTDSTGQTVQSGATDANGKFTLALKGSGPFILTAPFNDADGTAATLSSVIYPTTTPGQVTAVQGNLNPLTSLITQRVLGLVPDGAPTAAQIANAKITQANISQALLDVSGVLQPLFTALNVPASESADPIGSTSYRADPSDPLDNLFDLAHFNVHAGQIALGTDADRTTLTIPATGSVPGAAPANAVTSVLALHHGPTTTPIQNVIVVVGENQTFDAVFGAYQPPAGQAVKNLLSQGIINADGTPGPNFSLARQNQGTTQTAYTINPTRSTAFAALPQPTAIGELLPPTFQDPGGVPDKRFPANLPSGPFQLTKYVAYGTDNTALTGDPVHRFFQMWQQTGGDNAKLDLFAWVATTVGMGGDTSGITPANPGQGGELMGFLNMTSGDAPFFKSLAQQYALSDNYHQSIMGGTGANFFSIATGDLPYFNNAGTIGVPPANQIENPNPLPNTANFYSQDGYQGGSYVNCSDPSQPGVAAILNYLNSKKVKSNCDAGKYYLVNNYNPGFTMTGAAQPIGPNNYNYPPQTVPTIAEGLAKKGVAWKWYTGGREAEDVAADAAAMHAPVAAAQAAQYNVIGDPLVASSNVMSNPALKGNLAGLTSLYKDLAGGTLPAVSFVVPKNLESGHPGYSAPARYEAFLQDLIARVKADPKLWAHTAILVTTDEGGGHFDTGYIQNVDFFGDGPRIPFLLVSPYARTGFVDHTYYDHSSVLKFIERNWRLAPLSARSRDNLPNPVAVAKDPYRPLNNTAIGDLMAMFNF
ncbi:alkaline phosphatase family protein [Paraherbaspirillum soli]|uniref:Alkaline phosphatase family protein n=1 Tax=Paraherbaspirillum soli TaxID=631222 RepID=A0ABW0M8P1_9BURK